MTNKRYAIFGFLAPILFWVTYSILANQRTEYSFLTKAISELGSIDVQNKWIWNFFGYILTGFLISAFSIGLYKNVRTENSSKLPFIGFFFSGLFMIISGIFPGDFENRQSATMLWHTIGSFGSFFFFLLGAFSYPKQMKKSTYWRSAIAPSLILTWLAIILGGWVFVFPTVPAVGQRLVFLFYFLWIVYTARKLYLSKDV